MKIYIVQEFIHGEWNATIGAYTQIENALEAIGRIMEEELLTEKEFFIEGTPPFSEYWLITNGAKTFEIQGMFLNT